MATTGPVALFGGTFDPVHFGHLRLAEELSATARITQVRFVPSAIPPHRATPGTRPEDRVEMVRLATAGNPVFSVDDRELRRTGPGYTVDTLAEVREEIGQTRPLVMLLGADAFLELATWRRWRSLFDLAHIVVAYRPGFPIDSWQSRMPAPLAQEYAARHMHQPLAVHLAPAGGIAAVAMTGLDISATFVRDALRSGRSARYLLPGSVLDYIQTHGLYR